MITPPVAVCWVSALTALARPKSATLIRPPDGSSAIRTFSGLMSRWISPARCAAARAETTGSMQRQRLGRRHRCLVADDVAQRVARDQLHDQVERAAVDAGSSPWSKTLTTFGWESRAAARASRTNRSAKSPSSPSPGCMILTAQARSSRMSTAS